MMFALVASSAFAEPIKPFAIEVVDDQTGRGIPLVEFKTVNQLQFYTDSAGLIAFNEPGFMGRETWFTIFSHGYEVAADGFGIRGKRILITPGGSATIKLKRKNIAQRLYRVTGEGIYRDTVLLDRKAPIDQPVLNARVLGQDSILTIIYKGKLYWFWGDTNRESYPLGQFHMSGATSLLPKDGGLDPSVGVNLNYFVDKEGFSRGMAPMKEPGPVWLDGIMVVKDDTGQEKMLARYSRMKSLGERLEQGLMIYNDEKEMFEKSAQISNDATVVPQGQPFVVKVEGVDYYYFAFPYPLLRVKADFKSAQDLSQYEVFTCLKPGTGTSDRKAEVERDDAGKVIWAWKRGMPLMDEKAQKALTQSKQLTPDQAWINLRDVESGKAITAHGGTVHYNAYRKKYIAIWLELYGTSALGEVWFTEADEPQGPYRKACKIVTHEKYSFYNPRHHPMFDQDGGRLIYFEGTYADLISGAKQLTPRYDYNQIMYRLDLSDQRLKLE